MPKATKSKSPKRSNPAPKPISEAERGSLQKLIARHGPVTDDWKAAFDELITDDARALLGGKTRSENVFREGLVFAVVLDTNFQHFPAKTRAHYAWDRYRYFLDSLRLLDAAKTEQEGGRGARAAVTSTTQSREAAARTQRNQLISRLKGYAGGRTAEKDELNTASGTTENLGTLGQSIEALVKLGQQWLDRTAPTSKLQAQAAGLTAALLADATAAGAALTEASTDDTLAGRDRAGDSAAVNVAEGNVLHEMAEAMRCMAEAHADCVQIAKLVPGAGTRGVLAPKAPKAPKAPAPVVDDTPELVH